MHCAREGTAGFLSYQQFDDVQHHKVDGIDQVIPPLVPLALAAPLAVIQQQLQVLSAAVGVIIPLGDEKAHNGRGDHAEAEQRIVPGIGDGDEENRHMLADQGHRSQQLQCVGVQSGLPGHGDTLFPLEYLCGYLNT